MLTVIYEVAKHVLPVIMEEGARAEGVPPAVAKQVGDAYRNLLP